MAQDRLFHKRLGHSEKVNQLTDFEYIVWGCYVLSADDYGVMRCSAFTLQADHDRLAKRPGKMVQRAIERAIEVGLLVDFEHQGRRYVCQLDWQDFQKVRFPRETHEPLPPASILDRCSALTRELFTERCGVTSEMTSPSFRADATSDVPLDHANANVHANANGLRERFSEFWRDYPRKVGKDAAWKVWLRMKPSADLLSTMRATLAWQKQQDQWIREGGKFIPHPSTWLNQGRWDDEPTQTPRINDSTIAIGRAGQEFLRG